MIMPFKTLENNVNVYELDNNYLTIPRYGLVFLKNKLDDTYIKSLLNSDYEYSMLRYRIKEKLMTTKKQGKFVQVINVHPAGLFCYGNCEYCFNKTYPYEHFSKEILNFEFFDNFLKETRHIVIDEPIFRFLGGDCHLHDNEQKFFEIINKYYDKYHVRFFTDYMWDEKKYNEVLSLYDYLGTNEHIKTVLLFSTVDFGSNHRKSELLNLSSDDIRTRGAETSLYLSNKYDKYNVMVKSLLSKDTNINTLINEYQKIFHLKIIPNIDIVRDKTFAPSVEQLDYYLTELNKQFKIRDMLRLREKALENEKTRHAIKIDENYQSQWIQIEDSIFLLNPHLLECPSYINCIGINGDKYIACALGYFEEKTIDDMIQLKSNTRSAKWLLNLPNECKKCDVLGSCMRCIPRRKYMSCNDIPSLRYWELYSWINVCNQRDTWSIANY